MVLDRGSRVEQSGGSTRPMRSSRSGDLASAALPRRCRLAGPWRCRRLFLVGARRGSARLERGELKEAHQRRRRGRAPPAPTRRRALATRPRPGPRCDDEAASRDLATARPRCLASATLRSSAWPRPGRLVCCCTIHKIRRRALRALFSDKSLRRGSDQ